MSKERAILEKSLGKLLGTEDGTSDFFHHLVTIESKDDLLEFLTQLLGETTPEISEFVENMGRYRRGESLVHNQEGVESETVENSKTPSSASIPTPAIPVDAVTHAHPKSSREVSLTELNRRTQQKHNTSRVPPPKIKRTPTVAPANPSRNVDISPVTRIDSELLAPTSSSTEPPILEGEPEDKPIRKSQPKKGKASHLCGCYGTFHKPLTNCLYCGRISCVEEGYDFCPFCGYMVEDVRDGKDHSKDPNWERKERLLRFDREFARRTEIIDDHGDYQGPSTWMNDEERANAEENQEKQQGALKRPKQVLNLAL